VRGTNITRPFRSSSRSYSNPPTPDPRSSRMSARSKQIGWASRHIGSTRTRLQSCSARTEIGFANGQAVGRTPLSLMTERSKVYLLWHSADSEFMDADPELLGVYSTRERERRSSASPSRRAAGVPANSSR
jgi:hypothetical protein